jgi:hypothetical protein
MKLALCWHCSPFWVEAKSKTEVDLIVSGLMMRCQRSMNCLALADSLISSFVLSTRRTYDRLGRFL